MSHMISGIAVTARYGPADRPIHPGVDLTDPDPANYEEYKNWRGMWNNE